MTWKELRGAYLLSPLGHSVSASFQRAYRAICCLRCAHAHPYAVRGGSSSFGRAQITTSPRVDAIRCNAQSIDFTSSRPPPGVLPGQPAPPLGTLPGLSAPPPGRPLAAPCTPPERPPRAPCTILAAALPARPAPSGAPSQGTQLQPASRPPRARCILRGTLPPPPHASHCPVQEQQEQHEEKNNTDTKLV